MSARKRLNEERRKAAELRKGGIDRDDMILYGIIDMIDMIWHVHSFTFTATLHVLLSSCQHPHVEASEGIFSLVDPRMTHPAPWTPETDGAIFSGSRLHNIQFAKI